MGIKRLKWFVVLAAVLLLSRNLSAAESEIIKKFSEALEARNDGIMASVVETNKDRIPGEVKAVLNEASEGPKAGQEALFFLAERMANIYKDVTGDADLLKEVKKRTFEARLSQPLRPASSGGVHVVEAIEKNTFKPDNITIKAGETVKWVNNDSEAHMLASMPFIGAGGIFSPRVEPKESWGYKFEKPGEYYYICFIHKVMYGKISVER